VGVEGWREGGGVEGGGLAGGVQPHHGLDARCDVEGRWVTGYYRSQTGARVPCAGSHTHHRAEAAAVEWWLVVSGY
jgi:hypothetical protein